MEVDIMVVVVSSVIKWGHCRWYRQRTGIDVNWLSVKEEADVEAKCVSSGFENVGSADGVIDFIDLSL